MAFLVRIISGLWDWLRGRGQGRPAGLRARLGVAERAFLECNNNGLWIISSVVFISSNREISESHLKWVLGRLAKMHPLLRMKVATHKGELYWTEADPCDPELRVDRSGDWQRAYADNTMEEYDGAAAPLWRVTLLPDVTSEYADTRFSHHHALVMSFSHAIIDGQGRMRLINTLQDLLAQCLPYDDMQELERTLPAPQSLQMPRSYEHHVLPRMTFLQKCWYYLGAIPFIKQHRVRQNLKGFDQPNVYAQCVGLESERNPAAECVTRLYPRVIDQHNTSLILKACKSKQVSVHSAIQAAATIAICEMILEGARENGILPEHIGDTLVSCSASLSRHTAEFEEESYVVSLVHIISDDVHVPTRADVSRFWELAQHIKENIEMKREQSMIDFLSTLSYWEGAGHRIPNKRVPSLLAFTNLGNCNYMNRDLDAGVKVTAHFSGTGEHRTGPIFANSIVTLNHKMFWAAVYYPNVTTRQTAARYLHRSINILLASCRRALQ